MLKTLNAALKVLKMFTREKPVWGGRELANELNMNHTNVYRILETLEKNGFVKKDKVTKKYSLGYAVWELGMIMYDSLHSRDLIRPLLEELRDQTGESVFLIVLDNKEAVTLEVVEPENKVKFSVSAGSRAPLYVGASYRSILAFTSEEFIESVISDGLTKYTDRTMTDPDELRKELKKIRKQGWAISQGEYTEEVIAIAVPLFSNDEVIGSITVSGPVYRMTEEKIEAYLPLLMETRDKVANTIQRYQLKLRD
ncbi:MAG: IclR family transcriptional regulator [Caldibacillus debilis]|uniref:IclR family transcriptional regulator n=1 Tax=Caldibacillus debilis TaxID=301148 RepID=A0A3E0K3C6_9BACI|nr:IclR family transcriptional regulator [Caldibacillus debilis]OUM90089.1 MAG: IclR family transcriptional regulator [Caldibacillus debilis]REJ25468.1 MAG: IclR family transcriptional regulator [Caldibacillus debilis]REJ27805.1 MAG: IclR family transcriptional regulator [Caldibacillus debilis]